MRLGQLSRKLVKKPIEIVDFLAEQEIFIDNNSNAKVSDEVVQVVFSHFDPEGLFTDAPINKKISPEDTSEITQQQNNLTNESVNIISEPKEEIVSSAQEEPSSSTLTKEAPAEEVSLPLVEEEPEHKPLSLTVSEILEKQEETDLEGSESEPQDIVIKPEKVHLKGLKVVGKIDLPEPKPKEEKEAESNSAETVRKINRKRDNGRKRYSKKQGLSYTEKQKKEEEIYQRKRKAEKELEKKRKKAHYHKKVKQNEQEINKPKKKNVIENRVETVKKSNTETSNNIFQKFWKWLNT